MGDNYEPLGGPTGPGDALPAPPAPAELPPPPPPVPAPLDVPEPMAPPPSDDPSSVIPESGMNGPADQSAVNVKSKAKSSMMAPSEGGTSEDKPTKAVKDPKTSGQKVCMAISGVSCVILTVAAIVSGTGFLMKW